MKTIFVQLNKVPKLIQGRDARALKNYKKHQNLLGVTINRMKVDKIELKLRSDGKTVDYTAHYTCEVCNTSNHKAGIHHLYTSKSRSCGCAAPPSNLKSGIWADPKLENAYNRLYEMRKRVSDKNHPQYPTYGAVIEQKIKICRNWDLSKVGTKAVFNFIADMGFPPSEVHTIDRINGLRGYNKKNCKWSTPREQANNRGSNVLREYEGKTYTLAELARNLATEWDFDYDVIYSRIKRRHRYTTLDGLEEWAMQLKAVYDLVLKAEGRDAAQTKVHQAMINARVLRRLRKTKGFKRAYKQFSQWNIRETRKRKGHVKVYRGKEYGYTELIEVLAAEYKLKAGLIQRQLEKNKAISGKDLASWCVERKEAGKGRIRYYHEGKPLTVNQVAAYVSKKTGVDPDQVNNHCYAYSEQTVEQILEWAKAKHFDDLSTTGGGSKSVKMTRKRPLWVQKNFVPVEVKRAGMNAVRAYQRNAELLNTISGRLTLERIEARPENDGKIRYYAFCACGCSPQSRKDGFRLDSFKDGTTKSCGCLIAEARSAPKKAGLHSTAVGVKAVDRVRGLNARRKVGEIEIGKRWSTEHQELTEATTNFIADMDFYNHVDKYLLKRYDAGAPYSKKNCYWQPMGGK